MARKPLVLMRQQGTDCIVPVSHKLNPDGYFRKRIEDRAVMYHRYVYEEHFGTISEGFEVHHSCNNRACCNPAHLHAMEGSDHARHSNRERYADRRKAAYEYWKKTGCSGTDLGKVFNVAFSSACEWIREWKV